MLKPWSRKRHRSSKTGERGDSRTWAQRLVTLLPLKMLTPGPWSHPNPTTTKRTMTNLGMSWSRPRRTR